MTNKTLPFTVDQAKSDRVLKRIRRLGDAGHMPERTRKRLLAMAKGDGLYDYNVRRLPSSVTLIVTPSYELNRILGRLEARAEKAAA